MKILFTKKVGGQDYTTDCLFHGLRSVYGNSVVDCPKIWYMYKSSFYHGGPQLSDIYGRGFTIFGTLDDPAVDRTNIEDKIINQYFDFIIVQSNIGNPYNDLIVRHTPPEKIIYIDGDDESRIKWQDTPITGHHFKRELVDTSMPVHPISFAFPREKIPTPISKTQSLATIIPGDISTYIYTEENNYYAGYNQSLFARTCKKGGWDCMRHYEILACHCIPWFTDIAQCPDKICVTLPKHLLTYTNALLSRYHHSEFLTGELRERYQHLNELIFAHFADNCTTDALARSVIDLATNSKPSTV
jgi:hypothetical protein